MMVLQKLQQILCHLIQNNIKVIYINKKRKFKLIKVFLFFKVKIISYQIFNALFYLHEKNICHRDIKPQNILIDPETNNVKICDFGSAKTIDSKQNNNNYIQSRWYRAPEILFGNQNYNC